MSGRHSFSSDNFYDGSNNVRCPTAILSTGQNAGTLEDALKTIEGNLQKSISGLQNDVLNIKILLFNDGKKIIQN